MVAMSVSVREMANTIGRHHPILAAKWTDQSAHADYRPLPEGMHASYGQCIPSACEELRAVSIDHPGEPFRLAGGTVWATYVTAGRAALQPIILAHVWLDWPRHGPPGRQAVIDPTSGQATGRRLPPYLVATHAKLAIKGIIYQATDYYTSVNDLVERLAQSEPDIRKRINLLQGVLG
jgi:hypothetical protein